MRLVLDSNVWLDWLHFDDPGVSPLKRAKHNRTIEIVIDAPCRDELECVLGYDRFGLDKAAQHKMLSKADRLCTFLDDLRYAPAEQLPWCSDPDDIKFLALAAASEADWLITKDNALLSKRRRKTSGNDSYRVATPDQWSSSESIDCG
ncbi:MAG: putative toxin-antitoxin system toxin component, PIN family [Betaproteobacteria bacterium]|jgi:putative PIN family toxin of toxin-antitoxin system|nr:MAG: putative toxin-antitoxin system toxin component, PIN family [Betaproteobacteria bacterium]